MHPPPPLTGTGEPVPSWDSGVPPNVSASEGGKHKLQLRCALGQNHRVKVRVSVECQSSADDATRGGGDTCDAPAGGRNQHPQAAAGAQLLGSPSWHFGLPAPACAKVLAGSSSLCRAGCRGWPRQDQTCTRACRSATRPARLEVSPVPLGCCGQEQAAGSAPSRLLSQQCRVPPGWLSPGSGHLRLLSRSAGAWVPSGRIPLGAGHRPGRGHGGGPGVGGHPGSHHHPA